ncbi:hypothetical protein [Methanobrevibacter sp.]|uniref:hypothetical protein n=1 Tax=Methanobrevibacter sp. TaxID=66852 RepID=UPI0025DD39BE|nr:hypothetical protein [Methanobrevibacter sp.]MBQ2832413.1 hypothetical protein [Methanobrevibacter sp.]
MIFISSSWSENMFMPDHLLVDIHQIDEEQFKKYAEVAHSCIDKPNLSKIIGVDYNPEHVQLRPGDSLLKVLIKGGRLSPLDDELPEDVFLEYYCYTVFDPNTHVINEKIEENKVLMEE